MSPIGNAAGRRAMWLLNHGTAREFEVAMLKQLGFTEIFLPKNFPQQLNFRSASLDFSEDAGLSIPARDLEILNAADWYRGPDRDTWEIANKYFDLLFFIAWGNTIFSGVARHFRGAAILRGYGLSEGSSYDGLLQHATAGTRTLEKMGRRFWLGTGYDNLAEIEPAWLQQREVYLPVGLQDCRIKDDWNGSDPTIFFVCPDLVSNPYYRGVYGEFKRQFPDFRYAIGGTQSLPSTDPHVLGFVSGEQHRKNMREFRVMFYHSTERRHVHYTPFEAVRAGMPLVFMGGGLLDRLGGAALPGRCKNYREARSKLRRILDNDRRLIDEIRATQGRLLDQLRPEALEPAWRRGLTKVVSELDRAQTSRPQISRRRRIGVMLPAAYRGGTLRGAKLLAKALWIGSRQRGEDVDVVLGYPTSDDPKSSQWDSDWPPAISARPLVWRLLEPDTAHRAMKFGGNPNWIPSAKRYLAADDGVQHMCDCDLWVVVSDRLEAPLLPIRPYVLMAYDYVQRYSKDGPPVEDAPFLAAARHANRVLVTTSFAEQDALVYAGVPRERVARVPMLIPEPPPEAAPAPADQAYFLWPTNLGVHKNHIHAIAALRRYYELLNGQLECRVTGVDSQSLFASELPHLQPLAELASESEALRRHLRILGELPDANYHHELSGARFLWHPARIDNGTFTVVEAAMHGVPSLSSSYPAMEEMDAVFGLHLTWMDSQRPEDMSRQLKWMEENSGSLRPHLPCRQDLARHSVERLAGEYWRVVRECL